MAAINYLFLLANLESKLSDKGNDFMEKTLLTVLSFLLIYLYWYSLPKEMKAKE